MLIKIRLPSTVGFSYRIWRIKNNIKAGGKDKIPLGTDLIRCRYFVSPVKCLAFIFYATTISSKEATVISRISRKRAFDSNSIRRNMAQQRTNAEPRNPHK